MHLKTSKTWLYIFQKPKKEKTQIEELKKDARLDPFYKRIIAELSWFALSILFVFISIYATIFFFSEIFGHDTDPCSMKWLIISSENILAPTLFLATIALLIIFSFSLAMVILAFCIRKTKFIRESTLELIGRKGMV